MFLLLESFELLKASAWYSIGQVHTIHRKKLASHKRTWATISIVTPETCQQIVMSTDWHDSFDSVQIILR